MYAVIEWLVGCLGIYVWIALYKPKAVVSLHELNSTLALTNQVPVPKKYSFFIFIPGARCSYF